MDSRLKQKWNRVSASQVEEFIRCPRRWFESAILKNKQPSTPAMLKGTALHKAVENFIHTRTGTGEFADLIDAALGYLPGVGAVFHTEHEFRMPTFPGGPEWLGYIDLIEVKS